MRISKSSFHVVWLALGVVYPVPGSADERFTCWSQADRGAAVAAAEDYWTPERRQNAVDKSLQDAPRASTAALTRVDVNKAPYSYGGRLFFTHKGRDYAGTAEFVLHDDMLLTAGHNVFDEGERSTNVTFFRAYANGTGTEFKITDIGILKAWEPLSSQSPSAITAAADYAVMHTTTDSTVGKFALQKNADFTDFTLIGYSHSVEDGKYMNKLETQRVATIGDSFKAEPAYAPTGFSGGAWFLGTKAPYTAVSSTATGTSSYTRGPVFKDVTDDLFAYVRAGCK